MREIKEIIVHHSASDYKAHDDISVIREWHKARKFKDVGYHYFIRKDGFIQGGRPVSKVGAHCRGHNKGSIGVCLSGDRKFTNHQFKALATLIRLTWARLGKEVPIVPHSDYSDKDCPNFDVKNFINTYLKKDN